MLEDLKRSLLQRDLLTITIGLVMAFAIFTFLETLVRALIAPLFAVPFEKPHIEFLSFTVNGSEFGYGAMISSALVLLLAVAVVYLLARLARGADERH